MRSSRRHLGMALALACVGVLLSSIPSAAADERTPKRDRAVIEIEIQVQGGDPFHVTVWEGEAATVRSARHGLDLVVVPSVTDRAGGQVSLWVGEAIGRNPDGVITRASAEVAAQVGFQQPLAHFPVDVEVLDARRPTRAEREGAAGSTMLRKSATMYRKDVTVVETGTCCVSCHGDELCGCAVKATCGICCAGCCGGGLAK